VIAMLLATMRAAPIQTFSSKCSRSQELITR
jgi:hypothetical protein